MQKYVEVKATKEFANTFLADPILKMAVNAVLNNAPAADAVEVVHGHWIEEQDDYMICATFFTCSNCKESFCNSELDDKEYIATMKYCPNCGAKMDRERKADERKVD